MALSEINRRRLRTFKSNKRALYSLYIFIALFTITLFAELVANEKPIYVHYKGEHYIPVLFSYPETTFDGDFDTEADYLDPYMINIIEKQGFIIWPLVKSHYSTHATDLDSPAPTAPDRKHWLGTDDQGRDVLARVIYGFRISVLFALALTIGSTIIGVAVGAIQGYWGGRIDLFGQRFIEIWSGLPTLFVLIILASIVTPNFWWLLLIMLLFQWTSLVDLVRAEVLRTRNQDYVTSAKAMGLGDIKILFRHVLPNAMVATMTYVPFIITASITALTSLDFLGFGLPPGSASLGELVAQGKNNLHAPWLSLSAFIVLSVLLSLLIFIGEGLRDAFDPRMTQ